MNNYNVFLQDFFENNYFYKNTLNNIWNNSLLFQKNYILNSTEFIIRMYLTTDELFNFNFLKKKINNITITNLYLENTFFKKNYINTYLYLSTQVFKILLFTTFISIFYILYFYKIEKKKFFKNLVLKEIDQEFSNLEDFILWIFLLYFIFILLLNLNSLNNFFKINIIYYSFLFFSLIFFIPLTITLKTNFNLINYIKGSDNNTNNFVLMVFDFLSTIAYFLRFFLQKIRWILILSSYYLLHEFFFEINILNTIFFKNNINSLFFFENNFLNNLIDLFRILFEYLDFILMTMIQFIAFFVVLLWLFNFLFSFSQKNFQEIN